MIVHDDLVQRQASDLCGSRLGARDDLVADPDFAAVLADMNRAVHRLQGCVREKRNLVDCLDLGDNARHGLVGIADILRHRSRIERRLLAVPAASGWSVRRVGLAPTGKRRLVTAHTRSRQSGIGFVDLMPGSG
jgi:hypothetical protein